MTEQTDNTEIVELTADIVSAYVANNTVVAAELPTLINEVSAALGQAAARAGMPVKEELKPAVSLKKSVTPDAITCLECGKEFKSIKRHLRGDHELSPQEYRERWGLRHDYPMVAPNYAEARSKLAKKMGLGRKRRA
ncbi:MAG: MucR family transcriptional regulator [Methyloligellaceae bacterium]